MAVSWRTALQSDRSYVQVALADPGPYLEDSARTIAGTDTTMLTDLSGARFHSAVMDSLQAGNPVRLSGWRQLALERMEPLSDGRQ